MDVGDERESSALEPRLGQHRLAESGVSFPGSSTPPLFSSQILISLIKGSAYGADN